jgi:hypothetical protein
VVLVVRHKVLAHVRGHDGAEPLHVLNLRTVGVRPHLLAYAPDEAERRLDVALRGLLEALDHDLKRRRLLLLQQQHRAQHRDEERVVVPRHPFGNAHVAVDRLALDRLLVGREDGVGG